LKKSESSFIPAGESRWFITLFDMYVRILFRRRFHHVWVDLGYKPGQNSKTIYYLNHTSWWDGLIPLLLNQKLFRQRARAMMEDKQIKKHPFFKKIGAFSVNLSNQRAVIPSLRYAVSSMKRSNASLFIYPEGEIVPFSTKKPAFKKGLAWIAKKCPDTDIVPVGIYFNYALSDKPELFIRTGKAIHLDRSDDSGRLNSLFELELGELLNGLQKDAHIKNHSFEAL
jgi:chlorobactene lauroyltransferase